MGSSWAAQSLGCRALVIKILLLSPQVLTTHLGNLQRGTEQHKAAAADLSTRVAMAPAARSRPCCCSLLHWPQLLLHQAGLVLVLVRMRYCGGAKATA